MNVAARGLIVRPPGCVIFKNYNASISDRLGKRIHLPDENLTCHRSIDSTPQCVMVLFKYQHGGALTSQRCVQGDPDFEAVCRLRLLPDSRI